MGRKAGGRGRLGDGGKWGDYAGVTVKATRGVHMPEQTREQHRTAVAGYLKGKIKEFNFQLQAVVDSCAHSVRHSTSGQPNPAGNMEAVIYGFSAFTNAMQSLKDAVEIVTETPLVWSQITALRHGNFIRNARNAATHDGNPIISSWAGGRYFVPLDIYRYGKNGRLIRINRPTEDVRTICLEFANDFAKLLQDRLIPHAEMMQSGTPTTAEELEAIIHEVHIIPAFVKEMLARKRDEITQAIAEIPPVRPVVQAISELVQIADYCSDLLARN